MSAPSPVVRQLVDEIDRALVGPVRALLGQDLGDRLWERLRERSPMLAAQLGGDDDDIAAELVVDVLNLLWPGGDPDPEWWRTPVGRLCARSLGTDDADAVTRSVAAAMLGVHPGTIAQLVARGRLERHPDGGITRASVLMRLLDPRPPGRPPAAP